MGQKVNPISFRLPVNRGWLSRWFARGKEEYAANVSEDEKIRRLIKKKLRFAFISDVIIERSGKRMRITISTARPGIVIGRKGQELEKLKSDVEKITQSDVIIDIHEIKNPDSNPDIIALNIALQLERRISFRRAMKKAAQAAMSMNDVLGIRVRVAGRLGGADIARAEQVREGKVPLHTLREKVTYGFAEADTVYGKIGIKVWICLKDKDSKN